jgi:hypothetical protein
VRIPNLPFDKLRWRMNIAGMARRFLALLLIMISWFRVAGFDVLEDPDLSDRFELYCSRAAPLLGHGQTARPTEKFIDSAGHSRVSYFRFMEQRAAQRLIGATTLAHIQASQLRPALDQIYLWSTRSNIGIGQ